MVYSDSCQLNNSKEKRILECVDNFRRQYVYIYPDRKPLLLAPLNECGVKVNILADCTLTIAHGRSK